MACSRVVTSGSGSLERIYPSRNVESGSSSLGDSGTKPLILPGDLVRWSPEIFLDMNDESLVFLVVERYHVLDAMLVLSHPKTGEIFECPEDWFRLVSDGQAHGETDL